jgi:predicted NBD/HSP70 family sugar kinase
MSGVNPQRLRPAERLILDELRVTSVATRTDLARSTGLPKSTVTGIVARLLEAALVVEAPVEAEARRGRPASGLSLAANVAGSVAALAISRTATRVAVLDMNGEIAARRTEELGATPWPSDRKDRIADALLLLEQATLEAASGSGSAQVTQAVVGLPVPVHLEAGAVPMRADRDSRLRRIAELREDGLGLGSDPAGQVRASLRVPTEVVNDANLGALGEARFGAGRGLGSFVYLKVIDGLGAALILDGRLYRGATGVAGELAHVRVRDDGPLCLCGSRGCLCAALYLAPSLLATIQVAYRDELTMQDVIELSVHGDDGVRRILGDLGRQLGDVLAGFCVMLNPAGIVLDGMLGLAAEPVAQGIRESIERRTPPMISRHIKVLAGSLDDRAELLGAVAYATQGKDGVSTM